MQEHVVTIVAALASALPVGSLAHLRLWKKFEEEEGRGVKQLVARWASHQGVLAQQGLAVAGGGEEEEEELEMRRTSLGLLPLLQLTLLAVWLAALPSPLQPRLRALLTRFARAQPMPHAEVMALVAEHRRISAGEDFTSAAKELGDVFP